MSSHHLPHEETLNFAKACLKGLKAVLKPCGLALKGVVDARDPALKAVVNPSDPALKAVLESGDLTLYDVDVGRYILRGRLERGQLLPVRRC